MRTCRTCGLRFIGKRCPECKTKDASDAATEYAFRYHKSQERLALALAAIEAAKELVKFSISTIGSSGPKAIEDALAAWTKWENAVTKLEAAK